MFHYTPGTDVCPWAWTSGDRSACIGISGCVGGGDLCDPDLTNDGAVNFADLAQFKSLFLGPSGDADFNGDSLVNFGDLIIPRQFFLMSPGPSGLAP